MKWTYAAALQGIALILASLAQAQGSSPVAQTQKLPLQSLQRSTGSLPQSMHMAGNASTLLTKAFALYGIQLVALPSSRTTQRPLRFDIDEANLSEMARALGAMTHTFFVPLGAHMLLAVPDDKEHQMQFKRVATETFDVPNLDSIDPQNRDTVQGLLSSVFDIKSTTVHEKTVTLSAEPGTMLQARSALMTLYRPAPQVLLQVTVYLVSRTHDRDLGIELPKSLIVFNVLSEAESLINSNASVVTELIAAGLVTAGDTLGIAELLLAEGYGSGSVLGSSSLYVGGGETATGLQFSSANANANLSISGTQEVQRLSLHLADGQPGKLLIGEQYPVLTASTSAVTTSATTATPSIQYEDLGVTLEAKAHIRSRDEVALDLHQIVRSLHGTSLNNIPILDNQEFTTGITVPAGATTVMVSDLSRTETLATQGLIDSVPTDASKDEDDSELIITITPTVTRAPAEPSHTQ